MHNATAITCTTGSANQRSNTSCIRLWIDVIIRELKIPICELAICKFARLVFHHAKTLEVNLQEQLEDISVTSHSDLDLSTTDLKIYRIYVRVTVYCT